MYVNYFSIKLEGRETSKRSMHPKQNEKGAELEERKVVETAEEAAHTDPQRSLYKFAFYSELGGGVGGGGTTEVRVKEGHGPTCV